MRGETVPSPIFALNNGLFQSTPLMRGETSPERPCTPSCPISIHSPHARGDDRPRHCACVKNISIHSPHARGDVLASAGPEAPLPFQSTPLMRGETYGAANRDIFYCTFQSTPLMRGETSGGARMNGIGDFNPLPSCEGRHYTRRFQQIFETISIHSPHARGDSISLQKSIRIYVSLHNKIMIHHFSELYKPLWAAQNPIFRVRSPRKSHDSFTFAQPSEGRGITP